MTRDELIREYLGLAAEAEPLAPWLPSRMFSMRESERSIGTRTVADIRTRLALLRTEIGIATRRIRDGRPPAWTDIMDRTGIRPRPYALENPRCVDCAAGRHRCSPCGRADCGCLSCQMTRATRRAGFFHR